MKPSNITKLVVLLCVTFILAGCGSVGPVATPLPAATYTPRATLLPTVATAVPFGVDKPYEIVLVPPSDSSATGTSLASFVKERTTLAFKVNIVSTNAEVIAALCSATPTFAWVDGWTMLAAQAKGCGTPMLFIQNKGVSGIKADLLVSPAAQIDSINTLKNRAQSRDFCRMGSQDPISWVLPVLLMRSVSGFDPITGFRSVKDYGDVTAMLSDVSNNKCVGAIASGTLETYTIPNVSDITRTVKVLATTPELPYGGLMVSNTVPLDVAEQVTSIFQRNPEQLQGLVTADAFVPAGSVDLTDIQRALTAGGIDFNALGQ
jgi:ABC-type phosphate/phosphonate transport system substrate-binding protein